MQVSDDDRKRISSAIKLAEARTRGEIVCVLAGSASEYTHIPLLWAALAALVLPWPLIVFTGLSVQVIYAAQLACFIALALLLSLPGLRMVLVPRRVQRMRAHRAATEQFMLRGVSQTPERTGILIFVSLAERYARIIADSGIAEKVPQATWQSAVDSLIAHCKSGRIADGFVAAVSISGEVLAQHFPPEAEPVDALPDRLYVI